GERPARWATRRMVNPSKPADSCTAFAAESMRLLVMRTLYTDEYLVHKPALRAWPQAPQVPGFMPMFEAPEMRTWHSSTSGGKRRRVLVDEGCHRFIPEHVGVMQDGVMGQRLDRHPAHKDRKFQVGHRELRRGRSPDIPRRERRPLPRTLQEPQRFRIAAMAGRSATIGRTLIPPGR